MKKVTLLILVLIIALGGTACKKNIVEDDNKKQTLTQEEKNNFQFNDDGKIDRDSIEKQLNELLDDEFTIIYTAYVTADEINKNITAPVAPAESPFYEIMAYNFDEDLGIKLWSYGDPENNILNYSAGFKFENKEQYEILKQINKNLNSKKNKYYYLIEGLSFRENYNGVTGEDGESSYWWRIDVINKNDFARHYDIEGYMDTKGNMKLLTNGVTNLLEQIFRK